MPFDSAATVMATWFGVGLIPVAPGTWGTIAAIPLYLALQHYGWWMYGMGCLVIAFAGVWVCGAAASQARSHDHGSIVWDEVAGYLVTMLFVPPTVGAVVAGFVLFRLFDIIKPWPIRWLDRRVHGGTGIMLDDLVAGLFANLCLMLILVYIAPSVPALF